MDNERKHTLKRPALMVLPFLKYFLFTYLCVHAFLQILNLMSHLSFPLSHNVGVCAHAHAPALNARIYACSHLCVHTCMNMHAHEGM